MKRWTNLALFVLLGAAFVTGWLAFFYATAPSRASLIVHAVSGYAIIALTPWKTAIAARGLKRRRPDWWISVSLTVLVVASILAGILHSTGVVISVGAISAMEVHVGAALVALPFALWHLLARRIPMRAVDLSRRGFLRATALLSAAGFSYAATEGVIRVLSLPGAGRRPTGSYDIGSDQPSQLPVTQWMFDAVPTIDPTSYRLHVRSADGSRAWSYDQLAAFDDQVQATLDCTGGFYSTQTWSGVWLSRLVPSGASQASIHVRSATGYDRRFSIEQAQRLLLATRLGSQPLDAGHGFPVRLVSPGQRGYWWVKWVSAITLDDVPAWWQSPFPLQ